MHCNDQMDRVKTGRGSPTAKYRPPFFCIESSRPSVGQMTAYAFCMYIYSLYVLYLFEYIHVNVQQLRYIIDVIDTYGV